MIQFMPARAKKVTIHAMPQFSTEQKIDGQRYIIQTREGGHNCTSRRISVQTQRYVEKGDRVPHLMKIPFMPMSMIDCEFVAQSDIVLIDLPDLYWDKMQQHPHVTWLREKFNGKLPVYPHVSETTSIMGSSPAEAIHKQEKRGKIWAYAFDIVQFNGQSTQASSQFARRKFLAQQLRAVDPELGLVLMPHWPSLTAEEQDELFELITNPGGEGLIYKDMSAKYNAPKNWYKRKREFPVDVVLTGNTVPGTGKLAGLIGSLEIGVYLEGDLYPLGHVSSIMNSEANVASFSESTGWVGKVIECRHNGTQKKRDSPLGYTLRHPRFRRWRNDKNAEECTLEALLEELQ